MAKVKLYNMLTFSECGVESFTLFHALFTRDLLLKGMTFMMKNENVYLQLVLMSSLVACVQLFSVY